MKDRFSIEFSIVRIDFDTPQKGARDGVDDISLGFHAIDGMHCCFAEICSGADGKQCQQSDQSYGEFHPKRRHASHGAPLRAATMSQIQLRHRTHANHTASSWSFWRTTEMPIMKSPDQILCCLTSPANIGIQQIELRIRQQGQPHISSVALDVLFVARGVCDV